MQEIKYFRLILTLMLISVAALPHVNAAPKQITVPPETAKLPESKLPGYNLATQKCIICHSVDYISYQPPGMDQSQWTAEVAKMKQSYGASLNEAEIKSIGAYLAVVYGTAKSTDSEVLAVSVVHKSDSNAAQFEAADLEFNNTRD